MQDQTQLLDKVRIKARKLFNQLELDYRRHNSFNATEALEEAAKIYGLEHYGIEGDADMDLTYLNMGDTYIKTVCFHRGRFRVCSWGYIAEGEKPWKLV